MRITRRLLLSSFVQTGALLALGCAERRINSETLWRQPFEEAPLGEKETHRISPDWRARVVLRWGDPILPGAPQWRPGIADPEAQAGQFGYNNDYLALFELDEGRALLVANHEFTDPQMMFEPSELLRPEVHATEMAAQGLSVVELAMGEGGYIPRAGPLSRRITARSEIALSGPAAGSPRLMTRADPDGRSVRGTFGNCAGGVTPWGTVLSCEENFQLYFGGSARGDGANAESAKRYRLGSPRARWYESDGRFDLAREPNENHRFGWVVELDPRNPEALPIKRTALGRFAHESAETILAPDGRVVVYLGDDASREFLYRFVSDEPYTGQEPAMAGRLLDEGTLSVARFSEDGTLRWLPLRHGEGELVGSNGFHSQAEVLIDARLAASRLGATALDRPEDVHPLDDEVFVVLTGDRHRSPSWFSAGAVPFSRMGQILRLLTPDGDHAAEVFRWETLMIGGDIWLDRGGFAGPDNLAHDPAGNLWIATDQGGRKKETGVEDGLYRWDPGLGRGLALFRGPRGSEICGPCIGPDAASLFLAVQHPAAGRGWQSPTKSWPDFEEGHPPRPSVMELRPKA